MLPDLGTDVQYISHCISNSIYTPERCGLPKRATGTHKASRKINLDDRKKLDWLSATTASSAAGFDMIVSADWMDKTTTKKSKNKGKKNKAK